MNSMNRKHKHGRVLKSYQSAYPDPLVLSRGDELRLIRADPEWPGWLFCQDSSGRQGWVPLSYLHGDDILTLTRDYDATELTVSEDERFELLENESGWYRVRISDGKIGWIPEECAELEE
jgi:uncharacterized protein YgiM (DUF1202 family)